MRKTFWMVILVLAIAALSACNSGTEKAEKKVENTKVPQMLEAKLDVPETAAVNEKITMKASVTQGDEKVADANEVEFEVWEDGKKTESQMIQTKNNKDGTYEAETAFDHDGVFTVQVHVTARGLHTMPTKSVTVGKGAAVQEETHHDHEGHTDHEHGHGHGHGITEGFSMHFTEPKSITAGADTTLTVRLQMKETPLEKAQVRYEIWNADNSGKHEWVAAKEASPGEYSAAHPFSQAGTFQVKVHVENKEGLHEHEEYEVTVGK
ncbi:FixH family protein [Bacillus sp. B190/17]|uniref:FixH family protein n=1 Tax=Bacillus lumedeiriae TaxID=3058829 RepID=A0ABW8I9M8_9BACI